MSPFIFWLNRFVDQVFIFDLSQMLTFNSIGIAIAIFALSQMPKRFKDEMKILNSDSDIDVPDYNSNNFKLADYVQKIKLYWRFSKTIETAGLFYFISTICTILLLTFDTTKTINKPIHFIFLSNVAFMTCLIPTVSVFIFYFLLKVKIKDI